MEDAAASEASDLQNQISLHIYGREEREEKLSICVYLGIFTEVDTVKLL